MKPRHRAQSPVNPDIRTLGARKPIKPATFQAEKRSDSFLMRNFAPVFNTDTKDNKMKIGTIVCFIFSVIGLLALVAYFFPQEGVALGGTELRFPSLAEVLAPQEEEAAPVDTIPEDTLTTEELMQMRMDALKAEKESEFITYCQTNPARIYMPGDSVAYFDPFFDGLETAGERPMRILHYGDSQLEGDRITSVLREAFQERFGGSGVGLVPAIQAVPTYTLSQTAMPADLTRHLVYGPQSMRLEDRSDYGPMGQCATIDGTATFVFTTRMRDTYPHASRFARITLMSGSPVDACVTIGNDTLPLGGMQGSEPFYCYTARLGGTRTTATLTVNGKAEIYGILLDGTGGVSVDNVPMRGCSGTIFTSISQATLAPFLRQQNVRLVILQYGGNSVPYLKDEKGIAAYARALKRQIEYLKKLVPAGTRFLFIGPSEMSTSVDGNMQTYPLLPRIVEALKQAANESGIAYWDLYAAMGGRNSMVKWVDSQLAGTDYVHFTPKGARHVGKMLYETLEFYHRFYRFRTGKDRLKLNADSTELVIDTAATEITHANPPAGTGADSMHTRHPDSVTPSGHP